MSRGPIFFLILGLAAAAVFTIDSSDIAKDSQSSMAAIDERQKAPPPIQVTGGGLMPVPGGMGVQISGLLF